MPSMRLMHCAEPRLAAIWGRGLLGASVLPNSYLGPMKTVALAGHSVRQSARRHYEQAGLLALLGAGLLTGAVLTGADAAGGVAAIFCAVGVLVVFEARRQLRLARRFTVGARSEERVGSRLWVLEERGWLVAHDVGKEGGGNIDHLVHSPTVTFVVETKNSNARERDLEQSRRHARWAAATYGAERRVISVICAQRSGDQPRLVDGVYVVGAPHLVNFMLDRG